MEEEKRFEFEEIPKRTSTNVECKHGPPKKETYGLSEQGKLLSQVNSTEEEKTTTAVPPSSEEEGSTPAVAGTTHYSNVEHSKYYTV